MQTLTIQITVPPGTEINVQPVITEPNSPSLAGDGGVADVASGVDAKLIREFLRAFVPSEGSQPELYRVSAQRMLSLGCWTVDDLAEDMGEPASSVHAHVRNSGRTTHQWKQQKGIETPVEWVSIGYAPGTRRHQFVYRPGVAEMILEALSKSDG